MKKLLINVKPYKKDKAVVKEWGVTHPPQTFIMYRRHDFLCLITSFGLLSLRGAWLYRGFRFQL
jgi:hypothetical protein